MYKNLGVTDYVSTSCLCVWRILHSCCKPHLFALRRHIIYTHFIHTYIYLRSSAFNSRHQLLWCWRTIYCTPPYAHTSSRMNVESSMLLRVPPLTWITYSLQTKRSSNLLLKVELVKVDVLMEEQKELWWTHVSPHVYTCTYTCILVPLTLAISCCGVEESNIVPPLTHTPYTHKYVSSQMNVESSMLLRVPLLTVPVKLRRSQVSHCPCPSFGVYWAAHCGVLHAVQVV